MAKDFFLDPATHDLAISNFNFSFTSDNVDYVRQKIKIRLLSFQNEYFLDLNMGLPYFERILGKQITIDDATAILKATIVATPGVKELKSFEPDYDNSKRDLNISFEVLTDNNEIIKINEVF